VARRRQDRRQEATALTDLGVYFRQQGEAGRAAGLLEEALRLARELGDRVAQREAAGQLGLALVALGQAERGLALLEQELSWARTAGDRFAETAALEHRGLAHTGLRQHAHALAAFQQASALAADLGDCRHQAELLWSAAIQYAELNQRQEALQQAQAAVDLMQHAENPEAAWYAHHLERYRTGAAVLGQAGQPADVSPRPPELAAREMPSVSPAPSPESPGWLRMAFAAGKSMAQFLGSRLKLASPATHQARLQVCAGCAHHTGVRCRLCGCFTYVKARLAHEGCPLHKWPRESDCPPTTTSTTHRQSV
jgi:tetratricopeptide (TPR) repeat protein